jgi:serine protease Do
MTRQFILAALAASTAFAQNPRTTTVMPSLFAYASDPNAARIGVTLSERSDLRDTLGVLVSSVVDDSPAAKAGIKEGDRITAISGVSLRMTKDDAEDPLLAGMMTRRIIRELDKRKAGDEVELRLLSDGQSRTVRVKTVAARELTQASRPRAATITGGVGANENRASLGVRVGGSTSKRDTLGVLIMSVVADGPAEKAGVYEGDRIARINGVDLRVPSEDAGDAELSRARARRLTTEMNKLKPGDAVTLTVVTGGRSREVRITSVKASDLKEEAWFLFDDGPGGAIERMIRTVPQLKVAPGAIRIETPGAIRIQVPGRIRALDADPAVLSMQN